MDDDGCEKCKSLRILNLDKEASSSSVKEQYIRLGYECHPKRVQTLEAEQQFADLTEACYYMISNPNCQACYAETCKDCRSNFDLGDSFGHIFEDHEEEKDEYEGNYHELLFMSILEEKVRKHRFMPKKKKKAKQEKLTQEEETFFEFFDQLVKEQNTDRGCELCRRKRSKSDAEQTAFDTNLGFGPHLDRYKMEGDATASDCFDQDCDYTSEDTSMNMTTGQNDDDRSDELHQSVGVDDGDSDGMSDGKEESSRIDEGDDEGNDNTSREANQEDSFVQMFDLPSEEIRNKSELMDDSHSKSDLDKSSEIETKNRPASKKSKRMKKALEAKRKMELEEVRQELLKKCKLDESAEKERKNHIVLPKEIIPLHVKREIERQHKEAEKKKRDFERRQRQESAKEKKLQKKMKKVARRKYGAGNVEGNTDTSINESSSGISAETPLSDTTLSSSLSEPSPSSVSFTSSSGVDSTPRTGRKQGDESLLTKHLEAYKELMKEQPRRHTNQQIQEERKRMHEAALVQQSEELKKIRMDDSVNSTTTDEAKRQECLRKLRDKERQRNLEEEEEYKKSKSRRQRQSKHKAVIPVKVRYTERESIVNSQEQTVSSSLSDKNGNPFINPVVPQPSPQAAFLPRGQTWADKLKESKQNEAVSLLAPRCKEEEDSMLNKALELSREAMESEVQQRLTDESDVNFEEPLTMELDEEIEESLSREHLTQAQGPDLSQYSYSDACDQDARKRERLNRSREPLLPTPLKPLSINTLPMDRRWTVGGSNCPLKKAHTNQDNGKLQRNFQPYADTSKENNSPYSTNERMKYLDEKCEMMDMASSNPAEWTEQESKFAHHDSHMQSSESAEGNEYLSSSQMSSYPSQDNSVPFMHGTQASYPNDHNYLESQGAQYSASQHNPGANSTHFFVPPPQMPNMKSPSPFSPSFQSTSTRFRFDVPPPLLHRPPPASTQKILDHNWNNNFSQPTVDSSRSTPYSKPPPSPVYDSATGTLASNNSSEYQQTDSYTEPKDTLGEKNIKQTHSQSFPLKDSDFNHRSTDLQVCSLGSTSADTIKCSYSYNSKWTSSGSGTETARPAPSITPTQERYLDEKSTADRDGCKTNAQGKYLQDKNLDGTVDTTSSLSLDKKTVRNFDDEEGVPEHWDDGLSDDEENTNPLAAVKESYENFDSAYVDNKLLRSLSAGAVSKGNRERAENRNAKSWPKGRVESKTLAEKDDDDLSSIWDFIPLGDSLPLTKPKNAAWEKGYSKGVPQGNESDAKTKTNAVPLKRDKESKNAKTEVNDGKESLEQETTLSHQSRSKKEMDNGQTERGSNEEPSGSSVAMTMASPHIVTIMKEMGLKPPYHLPVGLPENQIFPYLMYLKETDEKESHDKTAQKPTQKQTLSKSEITQSIVSVGHRNIHDAQISGKLSTDPESQTTSSSLSVLKSSDVKHVPCQSVPLSSGADIVNMTNLCDVNSSFTMPNSLTSSANLMANVDVNKYALSLQKKQQELLMMSFDLQAKIMMLKAVTDGGNTVVAGGQEPCRETDAQQGNEDASSSSSKAELTDDEIQSILNKIPNLNLSSSSEQSDIERERKQVKKESSKVPKQPQQFHSNSTNTSSDATLKSSYRSKDDVDEVTSETSSVCLDDKKLKAILKKIPPAPGEEENWTEGIDVHPTSDAVFQFQGAASGSYGGRNFTMPSFPTSQFSSSVQLPGLNTTAHTSAFEGLEQKELSESEIESILQRVPSLRSKVPTALGRSDKFSSLPKEEAKASSVPLRKPKSLTKCLSQADEYSSSSGQTQTLNQHREIKPTNDSSSISARMSQIKLEDRGISKSPLETSRLLSSAMSQIQLNEKGDVKSQSRSTPRKPEDPFALARVALSHLKKDSSKRTPVAQNFKLPPSLQRPTLRAFNKLPKMGSDGDSDSPW